MPANPGETQGVGGLLGAPAKATTNLIPPRVLFLGPPNHFLLNDCPEGTNGWENVLALHPAKTFCPLGDAIFGPAIVLGAPSLEKQTRVSSGGSILPPMTC